jgi:hypothetical protein
MYEHSEAMTTPRRLVNEVMRELARFGPAAEEWCCKLAEADALLKQAELALYADQQKQWPYLDRYVKSLRPQRASTAVRRHAA